MSNMTKYAVLLRGIGPSNPNMHSAPLTKFFEDLGFKNVKTVISSGNIVFESKETKTVKLEEIIEKELPKKLAFSRTTIIRSEEHLKKLIDKNPFKGITDEKPNYLLVTFFKNGRNELATVLNLDEEKTPEFMVKLEREHGKEITSRTWKTIGRILKAMEK